MLLLKLAMKISQKTLLVIVLILIGFFILIISLIKASLDAFAQEEIKSEGFNINLIESSQAAIPDNKINYNFPYPGMLPDNPFYFLKEWRDKIWLFLTTDPKQKTNILLLIADKKIYSAIMLEEKNEKALAQRIFQNSQNYLEAAFKTSQKIKDEIQLKESQQKIIQAALAHQAVAIKYGFKVDSVYSKIIQP